MASQKKVKIEGAEFKIKSKKLKVKPATPQNKKIVVNPTKKKTMEERQRQHVPKPHFKPETNLNRKASSDPEHVAKSLALLKQIDHFLNVKSKGLEDIENINFEE